MKFLGQTQGATWTCLTTLQEEKWRGTLGYPILVLLQQLKWLFSAAAFEQLSTDMRILAIFLTTLLASCALMPTSNIEIRISNEMNEGTGRIRFSGINGEPIIVQNLDMNEHMEIVYKSFDEGGLNIDSLDHKFTRYNFGYFSPRLNYKCDIVFRDGFTILDQCIAVP